MVWFTPPIPPTIALIVTHNSRINIIGLGVINNIIINGLIFCHVARIIHLVQDNADITCGNHWWKGDIPIFIIILIINIVWDIMVDNSLI